MKAKGGAFADFDLDGDLDFYYGYTSGHYFENVNSHFIERTESNNINNSGSRGVVVGDLDNNGYPDILKLWLSFQHLGRITYSNLINNSYSITKSIQLEIIKRNHLKLACDPEMNILCFRVEPKNIKDPIGFLTSLIPTRLRRIALATF